MAESLAGKHPAECADQFLFSNRFTANFDAPIAAVELSTFANSCIEDEGNAARAQDFRNRINCPATDIIIEDRDVELPRACFRDGGIQVKAQRGHRATEALHDVFKVAGDHSLIFNDKYGLVIQHSSGTVLILFSSVPISLVHHRAAEQP